MLLVLCLLSACDATGWQDQHGAKMTSDQLAGKFLVVNYWAQWCAPCRQELPELNRLARDFPQALIIGIDFDAAEGEALRVAAEKMGIEFRVMGHDFAADLGLEKPRVLPTTYILDGNGELVHTLQGPQHYDDIAALLP